MFRAIVLVFSLLGLSSFVGAPVPARMLVTIEARKGATPAVNADTVQVTQSGKPDRVDGLEPMSRGDGLQLLLLIDDGASPALSTQFPEVKRFLAGLPPGAAAGLGYIRNGSVQMMAPIGDPATAANALRIPLGQFGVNPSPYTALDRMATHWPAARPAERREIVAITPGIEFLDSPGPLDPYLTGAIADLQKAGIVVFAQFTPAPGHFGHVFWRDFEAQNELSELADETGGESYMLGYGTQEFAPSFQDIQTKLMNQYRIAFQAVPGAKPGLQAVRVHAVDKTFDVLAADRVFVAAPPAEP